MAIETIEFEGIRYPKLQSEGFAAQYAFSFAKKICKGKGYDIGYSKEEWKFPGAEGIDVVNNNGFHAMNLPGTEVDYIFSSHCLEHLSDWVGALDYWYTVLKKGGVLFLYLPHPSQAYWLPWNNRKHIHVLDPSAIARFLIDRGWKNVFVTGTDLNYSFYAIAEK